MRIYLKNNATKFHRDLLWNDEALGFIRWSYHQEEQEQE